MKDITLIRIFKLIEESKFNFKEFAQSCSIAPNSITDWKTGRSRPSLDALRKISKTYKVQLEWLTGDSKYRTKEEELTKNKSKEKYMDPAIELMVLKLRCEAEELYKTKECKEQVIKETVKLSLKQNLEAKIISNAEYKSALDILKNYSLR